MGSDLPLKSPSPIFWSISCRVPPPWDGSCRKNTWKKLAIQSSKSDRLDVAHINLSNLRQADSLSVKPLKTTGEKSPASKEWNFISSLNQARDSRWSKEARWILPPSCKTSSMKATKKTRI